MMNPVKEIRSSSPRLSQGSILVYVLWVLVIVSLLAWQLAASSRSMLLERQAASRDLEEQLQLMSARRFAEFKILSGRWITGEYRFKLNNEEIQLEIINESGFPGLLDMSNKSRNRLFERINLDSVALEKLENNVDESGRRIPISSEEQLSSLLELDDELTWRLMERISLLHEGGVNLEQAPVEVLEVQPGVDQYRLQLLRSAETDQERRHLRSEIVESLLARSEDFDEEMSPYYRLRVQLGDRAYRIVLRHDRDEDRFKVLSMQRRPADANKAEKT